MKLNTLFPLPKGNKYIEFVKNVITPVILSRIAVIFIMAIGAWYLPFLHDHEWAHIGPVFLTGTQAWDTTWYFDIALHGYQNIKAAAFFPLFPVLIRGTLMLGFSITTGAFVVNALATLIGSSFLYLLIKQRLGEKVAYKALWAFLAFPVAMFLTAAYSEALFTMTIFGAFYFAQKKNPYGTGIMLALASSSRSYGLIAGGLIVLDLLLQKKWKDAVIVGCMAPLGLLSYMVYLNGALGDPLAFVHTYAKYWDNHVISLNIVKTYFVWWKDMIHAGNFPLLLQRINEVSFWTLSLILTCIGIKKNHWTWTAFSLLCLLFFIVTTTPDSVSVNRYVLPLFAMYPVIGSISNRWYTPIIVVSGAYMGALAMLFAACYWVG